MSAISVSAVMRMMFGRSLKERSIIVLGAFFDDSGTHDGSPVVAMGGLLGTDEQWDYFATAWEKQLVDSVPGKPKLEQFHLSPCRAGREEFRDYTLTEREYLEGQFRRIITNTGMVTVAAAINKIAWNELVTPQIEEILGPPLQGCFIKCIESTISIIRLRKPGEQIFLFFDEGTRQDLGDMARIYKMQAEKYLELSGIGFAPVKKVVALQGADMIATETFWYAQECMKNPENPVARGNFRDFIYRDLSTGLFFDRDHIKEMVERIQSR